MPKSIQDLISEIITDLQKNRPIFHSEADFQHAFAWWAASIGKSDITNIRLEKPIRNNGATEHVDIFFIYQQKKVAIELKYKTRLLNVECGKEEFSLANHSAPDCGRYDFIKDICRLEQFVSSGKCNIGFAIFLTNDDAYWRLPKEGRETNDAMFNLRENRELSGTCNWREGTSEGTKRGRTNPLELKGTYQINWQDYSSEDEGAWRFRYVSIEVPSTFTSQA